MINIPEILVANCCGAVMVILLFVFRVRAKETRRIGERLYEGMLIATLLALIAETVSFLIDGKSFPSCRFWLYVTNTVCTAATLFVGLFWCLFVDFRTNGSMERLKRKTRWLGTLTALLLATLVVNLFGNGIAFSISAENRYARGPINSIVSAVLFLYYGESIVTAAKSRRDRLSAAVFPVYCFVVPCMIGTFLQSRFYGLAVGWLSVAMAFVFVNLQMQNYNSYIDEMTGLFNRKYLVHCLKRIRREKRRACGIMLDANDFKRINDEYGHPVGDRAIRQIGRVISNALPEGATAMRISGDEYVVLIANGTRETLEETQRRIAEDVRRFNETTGEPYRLSLSMGGAEYDGKSTEGFLSAMDKAMYAAKKEYYQTHEKGDAK